MKISQPKINASSFIDRLDTLLKFPHSLIIKRLRKQVQKNPTLTVDELIAQLQRNYLRQASFTSAGVGASAAAPGVGTAAAAGLTGAEFVTFAAESVYYVLSVASLSGLTIDDTEKRRALVLSSVLGDEGAELVSNQLGLDTLAWAKSSLASMSSPTLTTVNKMLIDYAKKSMAKRLSKHALGKLIPFGIGATVGWFSGRALARNVIEGAHAALGEPSRQPLFETLATLENNNRVLVLGAGND